VPAAAQRTPRWIPAAALPDCLGNLPTPPAGLWCLGDAEGVLGNPERLISIVGTRDASAYGERMAARLAAGAARAGLVVVSGLARGIDAVAHRAAIEAGGRTVAVLGTGVDVPYPAGHRALHQLVQDNGAVLSEMEPGTKAFPGCFPRRNRIIAALSKLTLVVEAGHKSGAINTANLAQSLYRTIAAVPGQADDPRAMGSNQLLMDGASLVRDVEDLLIAFGLSTSSLHKADQLDADRASVNIPVHPDDLVILRALGGSGVPAQAIAERVGMSVRQVSERLLRLELSGLAVGEGGGYRAGDPRTSVRPQQQASTA
jgi:DNA processing protein